MTGKGRRMTLNGASVYEKTAPLWGRLRGEWAPVHSEQQGWGGLLSVCPHAFFRPFVTTRKSNNWSPREKHQKPRGVRRAAGHGARPRPQRPGAQTPRSRRGQWGRGLAHRRRRTPGQGGRRWFKTPGGQHGPQRLGLAWETQRLCPTCAHGPRLAWVVGSPLGIGSSLGMCMCSLLLVLCSNPVPDYHLQGLIPSSQVTF